MMKLISVLIVCLTITASAQVRADPVDSMVTSEMRQQGIPGLSLAVLRDGKVLKSKGYGLANVELNVPAETTTVYQLASMTKQFTAAGIMLLVEDGRVGVDDKLSKYLEDAPKSWSSITIRHLLTMTSGIKDYNPEFGESKDIFTPEQIYRRIASLPLDFAPGEKWSYSNTNYVLLGLVIHKASGKTWDAFLQERIFSPLGMTATCRDDPSRIIKGRASLYERRDHQLVNCRYINATLFNNGDGGLLTTIQDMAKWDAALIPNKLLKQQSLEEIWTPVGFNGKTIYHYGFGWFLNEANGHRMVLHGGGRPGSSTQISRFIDDHLTVIILSNVSGINCERIAHEIAQTYLPGLPPYDPRPLIHPPRWNSHGQLIPPP